MNPQNEIETLVRRWIEQGWTMHDTAVVDELHAPDFIDHDAAGRAADNAGFKQGITSLCEAFPDLAAFVEDVLVDKGTGRAAVRWSAEGTHLGSYLGFAPTERTIRFKGIEIVYLRDGLIAERWGEWDGLDLLAQLRTT